MRIVLDTNVFIAAALKSGLAEDILHMAAEENLITLVVSSEIISELAEKLKEKFKWQDIDITLFADYICDISEIVKAEERLDTVVRDPEDNKILECALSGKADLIVTSDQDLIKLKTFRGIGIIHPRTLSWTFPEYFKKNRKQ